MRENAHRPSRTNELQQTKIWIETEREKKKRKQLGERKKWERKAEKRDKSEV